MNDLTAVGLFCACLIATLGLVRICEWLRPREQARHESGTSAPTKDARE